MMVGGDAGNADESSLLELRGRGIGLLGGRGGRGYVFRRGGC